MATAHEQLAAKLSQRELFDASVLELYQRTDQGPLLCLACGKKVQNHPFSRTSHGRMHVKEGTAAEGTDGWPHFRVAFRLVPEPEEVERRVRERALQQQKRDEGLALMRLSQAVEFAEANLATAARRIRSTWSLPRSDVMLPVIDACRALFAADDALAAARPETAVKPRAQSRQDALGRERRPENGGSGKVDS